jgi:hypothetical protein
VSVEFLDPTHESGAAPFSPAKRLTTLRGATVGIVSNGKKGTRPFFDALERELIERHGVAKVVRTTKSNYSAPADEEIMTRTERWQALISGIGD